MNNSAFTFQTLHPDTIMDALFEHGIRVDSGLTPLNSYENRVYQFQDEDRRRFVVKFYRPERWTADQILEEHQFALQLVNDEVPVAAPVAFNGQTLLNHQGFYFAVFPSVRLSPFATTSFFPSRFRFLKKFPIIVKVLVFATTIVSGYAFMKFSIFAA